MYGTGWYGVMYEKTWYHIRVVRTLNRTKKYPCFSPEHDYDSLVFPASGLVTVMNRQVVFFVVVCGLNVSLITLLQKAFTLLWATSKLISLILNISLKSLPFQAGYILAISDR